MKKRGQFYLVAMIVIVSILIGFVAISNSIRSSENDNFFEIEEEIIIERKNMLDHIFYNDLSGPATDQMFTNFSDIYILKIGADKNSIFIYGDSTLLNLNGNRVASNMVSFDCGPEETNVTPSGLFTDTCSPSESWINISIDGLNQSFDILEGENFYYLIDYIYDEERFIING